MAAATMKVGIGLFLLRPPRMAAVARHAESLGFESVWLPEHVVFPETIASRYPYSADGGAPIDPRTPLLDPFVLLAQVAATTSTIRLGTNIYLVALRHPILTARAAVTLDVISGGRLTLGVGLGWLEEEFSALGIDFKSRAARTRESIAALRTLWTAETAEFHGEHISFGPVKFEPKPVQRPHPPIVFGGESTAALRRAALLGDGWLGVRHTPESARAQVQRMVEQRSQSERADLPFEVTVSTDAALLDGERLDAFRKSGVDRVIATPWQRDSKAEACLDELATRCFA